jgi:hypothetical protein
VAVADLAEVSVAYYLGEVIAMSGVPIAGLVQRLYCRQPLKN